MLGDIQEGTKWVETSLGRMSNISLEFLSDNFLRVLAGTVNGGRGQILCLLGVLTESYLWDMNDALCHEKVTSSDIIYLLEHGLTNL